MKEKRTGHKLHGMVYHTFWFWEEKFSRQTKSSHNKRKILTTNRNILTARKIFSHERKNSHEKQMIFITKKYFHIREINSHNKQKIFTTSNKFSQQ